MERAVLLAIAIGALLSAAAAPSTFEEPKIAEGPTVTGPATGEWQFVIGTEFLAAVLGPDADPAIARAGPGDTIEVRGIGTLTAGTALASGEGTYVHRDADGTEVGAGAWTVLELATFRSYGSASAQGLPENFYGGAATLRILLRPSDGSPGSEGTLRIECALGDVPARRDSGVRVSPQGGPNFVRPVSGGTLFILL